MGGDHFSRAEFVDIIVPEDGVPPDAEIDVSVDMVAPEQPGRYVSHWKLMAPGGKKFGHRVWCLIQVWTFFSLVYIHTFGFLDNTFII